MTRVVVMGVSGCGKSSVGAALAQALGGTYVDGDDLHLPESVAKMARGEPLTDDDRWPWLDRVAACLSDAPDTMILGCSALKRRYRDRIRDKTVQPVRFVHLVGDRALIAARMAERTGHYMPTSLLDSQFAALEPPDPDEKAVTVDIDQPVDAIVTAAIAGLERKTT